MKGVIVDDDLHKIFEATVHFDTELQEFRTHGGVIKGKDRQHREVTAPTVMWVKALDVLLDRLQVCGADLSTVSAVSGSGQVKVFFSSPRMLKAYWYIAYRYDDNPAN